MDGCFFLPCNRKTIIMETRRVAGSRRVPMRLVPCTATWEANEMNPSRVSRVIVVMVLLVSRCNRVDAAKLADVRTVDREHLMIHWLDGEITYRDDGQGPKAFEGGESIIDRVIRYPP